ncbi:hypothetical protein D1872_309460 [compost metagenome]
MEQRRLLWHISNPVADLIQSTDSGGAVTNPQLTFIGWIEPQHQLHDGALAAATRTNKGSHFAFGHRQT